jgi:hypothetical protein
MSKGLAEFHSKLRSGLEDFLSLGDLWLLRERTYPLLVLKNQPIFDDDLKLTAVGRVAVYAIGQELCAFPEVHSLVTGHVVRRRDDGERNWSSCHEAWRQARSVEHALGEAGVNRSHLLSMGIWRRDEDATGDMIAKFSPNHPFVVTMCFTQSSDELKDISWQRQPQG